MEKGETSTLHLRQATQELKDEGHSQALPELLRGIVRSIAADGRGEGGGGGSLGLRGRDRETVQVTLQREWGPLANTAELRRTAAGLLLDHLLSTLLPGHSGHRPAGRDHHGEAADGGEVRSYLEEPDQAS